MPILHRDEPGLERPQHGDRAADHDGGPKDEMHPERRRKFDLDQDGEADDPGAEDQYDEDRGPVARILCGEIEAAGGAARHHRQQTVEELALAAAWTAAAQSRREHGDRRISIRLTHGSFVDGDAGAAPPIDTDEEEQPDDVDEVPVPRRGLESEMMIGTEMASDPADQADEKEGRADDDMRAVEARRHEEGRRIDALGEAESGVAVLIGLQTGEADAEDHGKREALDQALAVVLQERVMRPGHGRARGQQYQRVEERHLERIEGMDSFRRP